MYGFRSSIRGGGTGAYALAGSKGGGAEWLELAPRRQVLEVLADVVPVTAVVLRVPELAIVGAGPDQAALDLRVLDRPDHFVFVLAKVVADQTAVGHHVCRILRRQIRGRLGPGLAG